MILEDFYPIAAIAPTPLAIQALQPLWQSHTINLWMPEDLAATLTDVSGPYHPYTGSLKDQLPELWRSHRAILFGLATGAVVRLIAPLLQDKASDPAILVVDGRGRHVISLCGGHQGGADRLTVAVARLLQATPVLTGGSHALDLPALDTLGDTFGWHKGAGDWTAVSAAIAQEKTVQVVQTAGSPLWQAHLPPAHPFNFTLPETIPAESAIAQVYITASKPPLSQCPTVSWHPRVLWVGIGCERGTPQAVIEAAVQQGLTLGGFVPEAIAGIATLDLKADEQGLLDYCRDRQLPLRCFAAEALQTVPVPHPSPVVAAEVGTPSVAEAAALLAAQVASTPLSPATAAAWDKPPVALAVTKQIIRLPGQGGAVTVAIAQAEQEYTGRKGRLWLVGMGPGHLAQMTPAAQGAIAQADGVIGYTLYIDLIRPLLRPGQIVEALPITQERQRAERAIDLAQWGLTVAVVSSGDCGIYGMAGLVMEQLQHRGWDGQTPDVEVFPGITALQATASRVGTPLMHDFCAISLSDLLTPWPQIEQRLTAAAQADFVTALYNPRSRQRTEQLAIAQAIFLAHRSPQTPVAIVQSAYRPEETITLTTLADLLQQPVDMLSTVLIGNQTTRFHHQWMITPRGYLGFPNP